MAGFNPFFDPTKNDILPARRRSQAVGPTLQGGVGAPMQSVAPTINAAQVRADVAKASPQVALQEASGSKVGPIMSSVSNSDSVNLTAKKSSVAATGGGGFTVPRTGYTFQRGAAITQPRVLNRDGMPSTANQSQTPKVVQQSADFAKAVAGLPDEMLLALIDAAAKGVGMGQATPAQVAAIAPYADAEARKRGIYPPKSSAEDAAARARKKARADSNRQGVIATNEATSDTVVKSVATSDASAKEPTDTLSADQTTTSAQTPASASSSSGGGSVSNVIQFPNSAPIVPTGTQPYSGGGGDDSGLVIYERPRAASVQKLTAQDNGWPWWAWLLVGGTVLAIGKVAMDERKRRNLGAAPLIADLDEHEEG